MTVGEMLTEIGDKLDDPGGNRFDPTKKQELLDQAQGRLIILLLACSQAGLAREDLLGVLLTVSDEIDPDETLEVAVVPKDLFAYRRNRRGEPVIEIGGKNARFMRGPEYKDLLVRPGSTQYASKDNPAYYEERGGIIPFPVGSKVIYHYVRKPKSFVNLDEDKECELPRILHPILVQDAIKNAAKIGNKEKIRGEAESEYVRLFKGVLGWL